MSDSDPIQARPRKDMKKSGHAKSKVNRNKPGRWMPKTDGQKPMRRKDLGDRSGSKEI